MMMKGILEHLIKAIDDKWRRVVYVDLKSYGGDLEKLHELALECSGLEACVTELKQKNEVPFYDEQMFKLSMVLSIYRLDKKFRHVMVDILDEYTMTRDFVILKDN